MCWIKQISRVGKLHLRFTKCACPHLANGPVVRDLATQNMNSRTKNKNQRKRMCCGILLHYFIHENKRDNFHACWTYCCCLCLPLLISVCKLPHVALQDSSWQEFAVTVWCFCQITSKCRRKQHEDDESEICSEPTTSSEISIWS